MKEVVIVHGYAASVNAHWFPWLSEKIRTELDISARIVRLPAAKTPSLTGWLEALQKALPNPGEGTFLVAHSLGCITVLKYIESLPPETKLGGIILVSGFDAPLLLLPVINSFTAKKLDYRKITGKVGRAEAFASTTDLLVSVQATGRVASSLGITARIVPNAGHFLASDGYKEFPELYEVLKSMVG